MIDYNVKELTPSVLNEAPDDATHFHPSNDGNSGNGNMCAAFFHKEVDGVSYFSYGKELPWHTHFGMDDCLHRRGNLIQIDNLLESRKENTDEGVPFETALSDKEIAIIEQAMTDDFDSYPLPDWALCENEHQVLVPGTQLATKDGRLTGNAHIICTRNAKWDSEVRIYECLTDAGNKITMTESELRNQFHIGPFISHVDDVLDKFDRDNLFFKEPK